MTDSDVIEFSAFEQSKENIQPNRAGRSAKAILQAITKPSISATNRTNDNNNDNNAIATDPYQSKRAEFECAIKDYSGDFPLSPWLNYIHWTQQTYLNS